MNRQTEKHQSDHSLISPTAKLVAWWRTFSDIPYAKEVAEFSGARDLVQELLANAGMTPEQTCWGAPILELRYKSLMREIKKSGCKQVLELASGISLRGLAMTEDPSITYVETDLPGMTREKLEIVRKITGEDPMSLRSNLHFAEANALDMAEIEHAIEGLDRAAPLAIVHEGLVQYFSRSEVVTLAHNIARLLNRHGGVWISPDFDLRSGMSDWGQGRPEVAKVLDAIKGMTGRGLLEGAFETEDELRSFFNSKGLEIERVPQMDPCLTITSASSSGMPPEFLSKILGSISLCKIRLRIERKIP